MYSHCRKIVIGKVWQGSDKVARDERIIIRLKTEIRDDFAGYAELYGMTVSSLGSYVIGQWVANHKKMEPVYNKMQNIAVEALGVNVSEAGKMMQDIVKDVMTEVVKREGK